MKTKRGFAPILILLLLGAIIFSGVVYFKQKVQPLSMGPTPSPQDENANPDLIGAGWKTYINNKGKYSFQYPPNLEVKIENNTPTNITLAFPEHKDWEFADLISIGLQTLPEDISISKAIEKGYSPVGSYNTSGFKFDKVFVGGIEAVGNEAPAAISAYDVHLIKYDKLFAFRLSTHGDVSNANPQRKIFDQILSTFKFIE